MNTAQVSREAAERWHRLNLAYPELAERALHETIEGAMVLKFSHLLHDIYAETYWTAGVSHSWIEGRGARAFRNCSIKSVDGKFKSKTEAVAAAQRAIEDRMLFGVHWDTAKPTVSFIISSKIGEQIGELMDSMNNE